MVCEDEGIVWVMNEAEEELKYKEEVGWHVKYKEEFE